ncbi:MAG: hypothetical protein GXO30_03780 [Epsilonproteobacteria bacterium]|nr:hypothetical protein [Campylobacterota bacterium]
MNIDDVIKDLNLKFFGALGIKYDRGNIIKALKHNLNWDIQIDNITHLNDLQKEIEDFQINLKDSLLTKDRFNFSYQERVTNQATYFDLDKDNYFELIDILEENSFFASEVKKLLINNL